MQISDLPEFSTGATNLSIKKVGPTKPWTVQLKKYLMSGPSTFLMEYMYYTAWQKSDKTQVCGNLSYTLVEKSWSET